MKNYEFARKKGSKDKQPRKRRGLSIGVKLAGAGLVGAGIVGTGLAIKRGSDRKQILKNARKIHSLSVKQHANNKAATRTLGKIGQGKDSSAWHSAASDYSNRAKQNKQDMQTAREGIQHLRETRIFGKKKK